MIGSLGWRLTLAVTCLAFTDAAFAAPTPNLLPNGSFQEETAGRPIGWEPRQWAGKTVWKFSTEGHSGKHSVSIDSDHGADFSVVTQVAVEPFAVYRLSGWIKTLNVHAENGRGALINIHNFDSASSPPLTGTNDWTEVEVVFSTCGQDHIGVNCCLGGWGNVLGRAWYDDLTLRLVGRYKLDYSYLFRKCSPQAPRIAYYGGRTAMADHPFLAPSPQLDAGKQPVHWQLLCGPEGMIVDADTGESSWQKPRWGHHHVLIEAKNSAGHDILDYSLIVTTNQLPEGGVAVTKHMDFVLPPEGLRWFEKWKPHALLDAQYAYLRKLIGHEPARDGKQIVQYRTDMGGGAHSGNPAMVGPGFWRWGDDDGWGVGIWSHEVGHNFNAQAPVTFFANIGGFGNPYHHHCHFLAIPLHERTAADPPAFGLSGAAADSFRRWVANGTQAAANECKGYTEWLKKGGNARTYEGDHFHLWGTMCHALAAEHGIEVLEDTLRGMRTDGIPASLRDRTKQPLQVHALLYCMMSHAARADLRDFFDRMGYEYDKKFYETIDDEVGKIMDNLPNEDDLEGWKKCPHNGHYYRRTSYDKDWHASEVEARQFGGHLATIRNEEELQWLQSRFGIYPVLWIGLHCAGRQREWRWISNDRARFVPWDKDQPPKEEDKCFGLLLTGSGKWQAAASPAQVNPGIIETERKPISSPSRR